VSSADIRPAVWPGSSLQYAEVIAQPRWEDMAITYQHANPWAHLGMGFAKVNREFEQWLESVGGPEGAAGKVPPVDLSPYLQVENIDPKWLKATGNGDARGISGKPKL
jgi:hypothetical protein